MTTLAQLEVKVAADLRDPSGKVFSTTDLDYMINTALTEIGIVAPARFQEDVDPVQNQFEYTLQSSVFSAAVPEIQVDRVELWDATTTPNKPLALIQPGSAEYVNFSATGWDVRDGVLEIPYFIVNFIGANYANYLFRVWGWRPYPEMTTGTDVVPVSAEREQALRDYCWVLALRRLSSERDLFTQWQTRAGNSDVSPAAIGGMLVNAERMWKEKKRSITVLRPAAG